MPKTSFNPAGLKPYNIVLDGDDGATINLYGEVVSTRPIDWWTGEPLPGNFIAVDEVLKDLEELQGKDRVTVHINSVGGDMYGGIAIYNRLKSLEAEVITINDGLAASAGSIIFQAGDIRKVNSGSNLMIHGALGFLYGYYQVPDLKAAVKQLEAHNKAGINVYAERTGRPAAEIKSLVDAETWMTGEEAVEQGFADEVISGEGTEPVNMKLTPDSSRLMVNGFAVAACALGKIPEGIPHMSAEEWAEMNPAPENRMPTETTPSDINISNTGGENMDIKNVTEMREAFPELVAEVEASARAAGAKAERDRIQGIEAIQSAIGDAELVKNAKFGETPLTAEQVAFEAMKAQAAIGATVVADLAADAAASGAGDVDPTPAEPENVDVDEDVEAKNLLLSAIPTEIKKEA